MLAILPYLQQPQGLREKSSPDCAVVAVVSAVSSLYDEQSSVQTVPPNGIQKSVLLRPSCTVHKLIDWSTCNMFALVCASRLVASQVETWVTLGLNMVIVKTGATLLKKG